MKMVKSLFLGAAAGLVAVAGAQAADLPVKAKPVQYVKICSLYGVGFYYIPGTDTCIKIGGWVRMQMGYGFNGNMTNGPMVANVDNRRTHDYMTRNRGYITADARTQTGLGTLRSYIAVGLSADNPLNNGAVTLNAAPAAGTGGIAAVSAGTVGFSANRAFVQLGGLTAGLSQSFYDFMPYPALSYYGGAIWTPAGADTGDGGQQVLAYTMSLGSGLSATLSLENPRNAAVTGYDPAGTAIVGTDPATTYGASVAKAGNKYPDVIANLRVDQAWGSAQIMGAIHDASAAYDFADALGATASHRPNATGYALGAGLRVNLPMLGMGDYFVTQFNWTKGAVKYATAGTSYLKRSSDHGAAVTVSGSGTLADGLFLGGASAAGNVNLTEAWSVGAAIEHVWNPAWKTSLYGGYTEVKLDTATICSAAALAAGCSGKWSTWQVGSRTQWNPVTNLDVGLDVIYTKLNARFLGANTAANIAASTDQDAWIGHLRIQRNFWP